MQFGCSKPPTLVIFCCNMQAGSKHRRRRLFIHHVDASSSSQLILPCRTKERVTAPARGGRIGGKSSSPGCVSLPDKVFTNSQGCLDEGELDLKASHLTRSLRLAAGQSAQSSAVLWADMWSLSSAFLSTDSPLESWIW
ncbi:hypothetical protein BDW75DRAFT_214837 [Aspergillus navahoensis]